MHSGRHTVLIELDSSGGRPQGLITVDGGREVAFYGWIDLTARLEALMAGPDLTSPPAPARAGRAPHG
jgi:hypothetical protein